MSPNEAIGALKLIKLKGVYPFYDWEEMIEVRNVAIKALEKQIPKKVTKSACPSCNRVFLFRHSEKRKGDYCDNCGQALDWSDTNA